MLPAKTRQRPVPYNTCIPMLNGRMHAYTNSKLDATRLNLTATRRIPENTALPLLPSTYRLAPNPHLTSLAQPCLPVRSSDPLRHPPELLPRRCVELGRFRPARQGEGTTTTSNTTMALRLVRTTLRHTNVGWILFLRTGGRSYLG